MKETKFDKLYSSYQEMSVKLKEVDHPTITKLLEGWEQLFGEIERFLEQKKVRKSDMVFGLKQGLSELPDIFGDLPEKQREEALAIYHSVIQK